MGLNDFKILILKFGIAIGVAFPVISLAQSKKMDLDDLSVKGEVHNDNRLSILARQQNKLKDYIHYRKEFRSELYQEAPKEVPLKAKPGV